MMLKRIYSWLKYRKLRHRKLPKHELIEGCPTCNLIATGGMFMEAECIEHCQENEENSRHQIIKRLVQIELRTVNTAIRVFAALFLICLIAILFGLPLFITGFGMVMSLGSLLIFLWWEKKIRSNYSEFL